MIEEILKDLYSSDPIGVSVCCGISIPWALTKAAGSEKNPNGIPNNLMPYVTKVAGVQNSLFLAMIMIRRTVPACTGPYSRCGSGKGTHLCSGKQKGPGLFILQSWNRGRLQCSLILSTPFMKVSGQKVPLTALALAARGDLPVVYSDSSKAKRELGWEARFDWKNV